MDRKISKRKNSGKVLTEEMAVKYIEKTRGFEELLATYKIEDYIDVVVIRGGNPIAYRVRFLNGDYLVAVR